MPYCRRCDEAFDLDGRFCPTCGTALVQPLRDGADPEPTAAPAEATGPAPDLVTFALSYPFRAGYRQPAIGMGLVALSPLVLPVLALLGYTAHLGRAAARGDETPPPYHAPGRLVADGMWFAATILPIVVVASAGIWWVSLWSEVAGTDVAESFFVLAIGPAVLVALYLGGGAIPTLFGTGSVLETYRRGRFLSVATTRRYLGSFLLYVVVLSGLTIAYVLVVFMLSILLVISIVGIPFLLVLYPVAVLLYPVVLLAVSAAWWGHVWHEAPAEPPFGDGDDASVSLEL